MTMTELAPIEAYGVLSADTTLTIRRRLPGPIERVWAYLTQSDLRRQWLASGDMTLAVGAPVELVWRNDELTDPPGARPAGASTEHRMISEITACDPPHKLAITWGSTGGVTVTLEPHGNEVLLTLVHRRLGDRSTVLNVGAGWHMHLDLLAARIAGTQPEPFWDGWARLKQDYHRRLPA